MAITSLLSAAILLLFLHAGALGKGGEEDFFRDCPPHRCEGGKGGLEIRYPFRLHSSPLFCGVRGLELSCSGEDTVLSLHSSSTPYKVTAIDYGKSQLTIKLGDPWEVCRLQNLTSITNLATPIYSLTYTKEISFVSCPTNFTPKREEDTLAGPFSCLSAAGSFTYIADGDQLMDGLPSDCLVVSTGHKIPDFPDYSFVDLGNASVEKREVSFTWSVPPVSNHCATCEIAGKRCVFSRARDQAICLSHHGSHVKLIAGPVSGLAVLVSVSLVLLYLSRKSEKEKKTRLRVEKFLSTYRDAKPTRYTYSGIKKITKRFSHKLGQGGFGSVYQGELPNGVPVAIKMLEKSKGEGEEFINEVATIGRIHHVNVVRLLGFCSEGTRHALVYEFMPNASLEKFIFSKEAKRAHQPLTMEKLEEISIGIARGVEYLHQGCDQRILHFDIKPHNILLDDNLNPKISDFGLAKLCSRDHSIVTMTAARGTMGYIAPEIYSRNFGTVSYKSDVYSFGMLLLEMVSGKKNVDPEIENVGDTYFPEWVYDQLVQGDVLGWTMGKGGKEEEIVKKLVIVALWCIQWSPMDRPSMTRVVQMLMGNLEGLEIPPQPFVSSSDQDNRTSRNVVEL